MLMTPRIGPKKTLTCTLATATWVEDGSTIPATESTRWGRTLQASDFPTWSFPPESIIHLEKCLVSVRNDSAGSQTINWKIYKNNSQVSTGNSSIVAGQYKTFTANFYNVSVGDVLELAIWTASNTNVTVTGSLYHVIPTRLLPTSKPCIDVTYSFNKYTYPSPLTNSNVNSVEYIGNNITSNISSETTRTFIGHSFVSQNGYGLFKYGSGDVSATDTTGTNANASAQQIPNSYYPTTISYREIRGGR